MKKKFYLISLPLMSIGGLSFILPHMVQIKETDNTKEWDISKEINSLKTSINSSDLDLDLTTPIFKNKIVQSYGEKDYISYEDYNIYYDGQNTLSSDSINTVRTENYFFNFVHPPEVQFVDGTEIPLVYDSNKPNGGISRKQTIQIIATPIDENNPFILTLDTEYTSIEDSAIYLGNSLILIGTKGIGVDAIKEIATYQIRNYNNGSNNNFKELIKMQSKVVHFDETSATEIKYALSPITTNFTQIGLSSMVLWAMGANITDFNANPELIKKVSVANDGSIKIENMFTSLNFEDIPITFGSQHIVSLTPIEYRDEYNEARISIFAFSRGTLPYNPVRLIRFNDDPAQTTIGKTTNIISYPASPTGRRYIPPALESVVPYAMVRQDDTKNYRLYWINQNDADRSTNALTIQDESLLQLTIPEVDVFPNAPIEDASPAYKYLAFRTAYGGYLKNTLSIDQIHYGYGGDSKQDSWISVSFRGAFYSTSPEIVDNNSRIGAMEMTSDLWDYPEWYHKIPLSLRKNHQFVSANTNIAAATPYAMATIYNNNYVASGISPYTPTAFDPLLPAFYRIRNMSNFGLQWTSKGANKFVLPINIPKDNPLYNENLPTIKVKLLDLNYSNPMAKPVNNSILWYARNYISDIYANTYNLSWVDVEGVNLRLSGVPIFKDINGNVIQDNVLNPFIAPEKASSVEVEIVLPLPLINAQTAYGNPLTIKMEIFENPSNSDQSKLDIGSGTGNASSAKVILETLSQTGLIPENQNIVSTNNDALININPLYFEESFNGISDLEVDTYNGTLKGNINFLEVVTKINEVAPKISSVVVPFLITGFNSNVFLIPIIVVPVASIILITAITIGVLIYKNKKKQVIVSKASFNISKKINLGNQSIGTNSGKNLQNKEPIKIIQKRIINGSAGLGDIASPFILKPVRNPPPGLKGGQPPQIKKPPPGFKSGQPPQIKKPPPGFKSGLPPMRK